MLIIEPDARRVQYNANNVREVMPGQGVARTDVITGLSGINKWAGGVLGADGRIYGIPYSAPTVLIINPITHVADTTTMVPALISPGSPVNKWAWGTLAPNGNIYGIPCQSDSVLVINPASNTSSATAITGLQPSSSWRIMPRNQATGLATPCRQWMGGTLAANGKIYSVPFNGDEAHQCSQQFSSAPPVLIIDPVAMTADMSLKVSSTYVSTQAWAGAVLASNGKIYGIPYVMPYIISIDPATDSLDLFQMSRLNARNRYGQYGNWYGGALAPNQKIFGIPNGFVSAALTLSPSQPTDFEFSGCELCASGKYSSGRNDSPCIPCAAGKASSALGLTSSSGCVACPAGQYSPTHGASTCLTCQAGQMSSEGSTECTACVYPSRCHDAQPAVNSTTGGNSRLCSKGSTGIACASCMRNEELRYYQAGSKCLECSGETVLVAVILTVLCIVIILSIWYVSRTDHNDDQDVDDTDKFKNSVISTSGEQTVSNAREASQMEGGATSADVLAIAGTCYVKLVCNRH
eukprot:COSAG01_NODE_53_length_31352_cov_23.122452_11_plen_521_part_00